MTPEQKATHLLHLRGEKMLTDAIVAYWNMDSGFHRRALDATVDQMEAAIAQYRALFPKQEISQEAAE
jgi:predicted HD phosphohydrolase